MTASNRLSLTEIEKRTRKVVAELLNLQLRDLLLDSRLVQDLNCDSIDFLDLMYRLESEFGVSLKLDTANSASKSVFTRSVRVADLAEVVYLQQDDSPPRWRSHPARNGRELSDADTMPFTQLSGIWRPFTAANEPLFDQLEGVANEGHFRRRSDGMRCIQIPDDEVEIGCDGAGLSDESPKHVVEVSSFLIDAEPVSTTAYCRFLNTIGDVDPKMLRDWFVLDSDDDRNWHMPIVKYGSEWTPVQGADRWPMTLVSWYGSLAYSLWANRQDWRDYGCDEFAEASHYLPTEAQWEYAARGAKYREYPWGEAPASDLLVRAGLHTHAATYAIDELPFADVNEQLGMSPFGLHHMAGNVWQWCRDWYDETFYQRSESRRRDPFNQSPTEVRCERGGSWVGPAELCRSSYRRGRAPLARGRCLGFRCVSPVPLATK